MAKKTDAAPEPLREAKRAGQMSTPIEGAKLVPLGKPQTRSQRIAEAGRAAGHVTVRATAMGEYEYKRRRIGDVFTIPAEVCGTVYTEADRVPAKLLGKPNPKAGKLKYLGSWMEIVSDDTPLRETGANQAIDREREAIHQSQGGAPSIDSLAE